MKFDLESLSAEPLLYMLKHSGAFVCVLGAVFFVVGLLFGYATWGRYKRQTRELRGETESLKEEIAVLKRKVGDQSFKAGPTIAMATETIYMPKKEGAAAAEEPAPAAAALAKPETSLPKSEAAEPPKSQAPVNVIKAKTSAKVEPLLNLPVAESEAAPAPAAAAASAETPPPPARPPSPLASIISPGVAAAHEEERAAESAATAPAAADSPPADVIPAVVELPVTPLPGVDMLPELDADKPAPAPAPAPPPSAPVVDVLPELDPTLGLIYKTRPEKADDLTALKGISQVLEQRLNEFGIYTFAQIAAWDDERIREFSTRLSFKDRIHREHWVEQALQLAAKKAEV